MPSFIDVLKRTANKNGWDFEMKSGGTEGNDAVWEFKYTNQKTGEVWDVSHCSGDWPIQVDPDTLVIVLYETAEEDSYKDICFLEKGEELDLEMVEEIRISYVLSP